MSFNRYLVKKIAGFICVGMFAPAILYAADTSTDTYNQLNLFSEVFEKVKDSYVEPVKDDEMMSAALNGMLSSLDPHSSYMTPKEFEDMRVQTRGEFGGLGLEVTMENGMVKVISPIEDTPSAKAGILSGDLIAQVNKKPVAGMTLNQIVGMMRGKVGETVTLTLKREGVKDLFDVNLKRALIKVKSIKYRVEGNVGYIRISSFNDQTQVGLEAAIADIKKQLGDKLAGYVLDLRNNPGGLLDQAVSVSDTFLSEGEIVSTKWRDSNDNEHFYAHAGDLADGLPIVVLLNGGSASASEIVAGALQDHSRAIIMGTQSFGKGSVQLVIPLKNSGALRLTTARYYTPSGRSIQGMGIKPDIEVLSTKVEEKDVERYHEADLPSALKNDTPVGSPPVSKTGEPIAIDIEKVKAPSDPKKSGQIEVKIQDYQLDRALDMIQGLALYRKAEASNH